MNENLKLLFLLLLLGLFSKNTLSQSLVVLDNCGVSYIDPQDEAGSTTQSQDTLRYITNFSTQHQLRSYYVDINAFGGQQVDRTTVYMLLPDEEPKMIGSMAFGGCIDCVEGFALVVDSTLEVEGVTDINTMEMWLLSFSQPDFTLTGNLQTLNGVGRISGTIPPCATGLMVEYIVFSDPQNTTTEFSTHIICPEEIMDCTILPELEIDCPNNIFTLHAEIPDACFSPNVSVTWSKEDGTTYSNNTVNLPLDGNEGKYYLVVEDECCRIIDSLIVENPSFAQAGVDEAPCQGDQLTLTGAGGVDYFWELPDGAMMDGQEINFNAIQADEMGAYVLHAFNEIGCEDTDTLIVTVNVPETPIVEVSDACIGETANFSVVNDSLYAQLNWFDPNGNQLPVPVINNLQIPDFGLYSLSATDLNACTVNTNFEVSGSEPPSYEYIFEEGCDSTIVYLFPEDLQYEWETGDSGAVFSTDAGGLYSLSITDAEGCTSVDQVNVPPPDDLAVAINLVQPECPGDFGAIEIMVDNRPFIFSIDGGQNYFLTPNFDQVVPDTYTVVIQDDLGCVQQTTVEIIQPDTLGVNLDIDFLELRPNTPVSLNANTIGNVAEYQWIPEEINTQGPNTDFIATNDMDIRIVVKDERGCHASDGFQLSIVLGDIYVPNAFSPDNNGVNDRFTFYSDNGSGEIIEVLRIFDRYGALLFEAEDIPLNDESQGWDGTFKGKSMNTGVMTYFGKVKFGDGSKKIFKGDVTLLR
jgi:gliding motility-associated-like protein